MKTEHTTYLVLTNALFNFYILTPRSNFNTKNNSLNHLFFMHPLPLCIFYPSLAVEERVHLFQGPSLCLWQEYIDECPSHHTYTSKHKEGPTNRNCFVN